MLKKLVSHSLIGVTVFLTCSTAFAQIVRQPFEKPNQMAAKTDLKTVFARENRKMAESKGATVDVAALEKESIKQRARQNNLTGQQKMWLWIGIGAAAAAVVTIIVLANRNDDQTFQIPDCRLGPC